MGGTTPQSRSPSRRVPELLRSSFSADRGAVAVCRRRRPADLRRTRKSGIAASGALDLPRCCPPKPLWRSAFRDLPRWWWGCWPFMCAGGAFVPLDPSWPAERRESGTRRCRRHAGAHLGRCRRLRSGRSLRVGVRGRALGPVRDNDLRHSYSRVPNSHTSSSTSGSTGRPKGAMIRHEAICARLLLAAGADSRVRVRRCLLVQSPTLVRHLDQRDPAPARLRRSIGDREARGGTRPAIPARPDRRRIGHFRLPGLVDARHPSGSGERDRSARFVEARVVRR